MSVFGAFQILEHGATGSVRGAWCSTVCDEMLLHAMLRDDGFVTQSHLVIADRNSGGAIDQIAIGVL